MGRNLGLRMVVGVSLSLSIWPALGQSGHVVRVTPETVRWGHYGADVKPVLTVGSGEVVTMDTVVGIPAMLERLGAPADAPYQEMVRLTAEIQDRGPGPHFLTGPVAIESAEPGDVLEVQILEVRLRSPYGWMSFGPDSGILPERFPYSHEKLVPLDRERMVADFAPGVRVPLRPFFGSMGVAPPSGRLSSGPPNYHAGNIDNRQLVAGSTLYIPIHVPGALFYAGDGHASQGDGEVCVTAVETNLTGVFRLTVRKDLKLLWPRAETPSHFITMGLHHDLDEAARRAVVEMIDYLTSERGLSRDDAYMLTSAAVDLNVTQVVDGTKGVHAMLPKAIFFNR